MSNSMRMLYKQLLLRAVFFRKRLDKFTRGTVFPSYSRSGWLEAETQNAWQWGQLYLVPLLAALCPLHVCQLHRKRAFKALRSGLGYQPCLRPALGVRGRRSRTGQWVAIPTVYAVGP